MPKQSWTQKYQKQIDTFFMVVFAIIIIAGIFFWREPLVQSGLYHYSDAEVNEIVQKMKNISGIGMNITVKIEDFETKCIENVRMDGIDNLVTWCASQNATNRSMENNTVIVPAWAFAMPNGTIYFSPASKDHIDTIAHEVAHVKLFDMGINATLTNNYHHDSELFKCWAECIRYSYELFGLDLCGTCKS